MSLVAINQNNQERINISIHPDPLAVKRLSVICPLCQEPMITKVGDIKIPHFAHRAKSDCSHLWESHPESENHMRGKSKVMNCLFSHFDVFSKVYADMEIPIPMDWRARGRVADVILWWPFGMRWAHEIQLAKTTPDELQSRTEDYLASGIEVTWWLGNKADTKENSKWALQTFGSVYRLDSQLNFSYENKWGYAKDDYWVTDSLFQHWRYLAPRRYLEIWGDIGLSGDLLSRAIGATPELNRYLGGMMSFLNSGTPKIAYRHDNDRWYLRTKRNLYSTHLKATPLSDKAISSAKEFAYTHRSSVSIPA